MNTFRRPLFVLLAGYLLLIGGTAAAQDSVPGKDPFNGRLFPPNVILEHQQALDISEQQLAAIRAAVIEVQGKVAEHQWDLREAYQRVMTELERSPIDEEQVLANIDQALLAENRVKKTQVAMLIKLRNLLTDEQVDYLRSVRRD